MEPMQPTNMPPATKIPSASIVWLFVAAIVLAATWYFAIYSPRGGGYSHPETGTTYQPAPGTSDGVSSIEQDLGATDFGAIDKDLSSIDSELAR